jgi:hypothetical protein
VLTKFIYSLAIGISLLFLPTPANAEDIIINLDATTPYVDVIVQVDTTTAYTITTTTGPRFEVVDSQTVERVAWVDSWLWLYRGVADSTTANPIRGDDDSNHTQNNWLASAISGTLNADTYTIRATSYDYVVAGQRPIGTYTLSSNLIPPLVDTSTVTTDTSTVVADTNTATVDGTTATVDTSTPVAPPPAPEPPAPAPEPPAIIFIPPVVEPEPPVVVEEPPAVEEPPIEIEEPPIEAEEPPDVEEEAPVPVEEPPVEEELPIEEEELPAEEELEVAQADEVDLETLAPETPVQLENGVVLEAGTVVALQLLENPAELIAAIFDNPAEVFTALSNIGADMSEEEREESEKVIIASVIATQAAVGAATMAASGTTRTSAPTPSSPAGGPMAGNDKPRASRRRAS